VERFVVKVLVLGGSPQAIGCLYEPTSQATRLPLQTPLPLVRSEIGFFRISRSALAVCHDTNHQSTHHRGFSICGRGDGSGRGRRDGRGLGVTLGVPLGVALAVAVGVTEGVTVGVPVALGVGVGVSLGVEVGVGVCVGVGVGAPSGSLKAYTLLSAAT
jgi:hypothetical protein